MILKLEKIRPFLKFVPMDVSDIIDTASLLLRIPKDTIFIRTGEYESKIYDIRISESKLLRILEIFPSEELGTPGTVILKDKLRNWKHGSVSYQTDKCDLLFLEMGYMMYILKIYQKSRDIPQPDETFNFSSIPEEAQESA